MLVQNDTVFTPEDERAGFEHGMIFYTNVCHENALSRKEYHKNQRTARQEFFKETTEQDVLWNELDRRTA